VTDTPTVPAHSLIIDLARSWDDVVRLARAAEEHGAHAVYVPDHFMQHTGDDSVGDGPMMEGWTALTGLAAVTSRIRLGTLVLGATYRHPAVVANMAATLDHVSGGRVVLGLGAGWQRNEHDAYGIELPPVRTRLDRFEEHTRVVHSLLRHARTTLTGDHFSLTDAPCRPAPLQRPLPILVGGGGEKRTLWATPEELDRKNGVLDAHCRDLGRDPGEIRRVGGRWVDDLDVRAHLASYAGVADEVVLLDHRDQPLADTVAVLREAAP
jgi:alkanesulfonate monooxygenase SsuD/methylene tetrahydromethanopterin reductase-like flavin-dependent oxidoreductase (luciferase family)